MTDYIYSLSLADQTENFLFSLGAGFILGIFYDAFRIVRMCISEKRSAIIVSDVLYCILFTFATFIFLLTVNEGEFRLYLIAGEFMGFAVYYFSLGALFFSFSTFLTDMIKRCVRKIFDVVFYPIKLIFLKSASVFDKILEKGRKRSKKHKKRR